MPGAKKTLQLLAAGAAFGSVSAPLAQTQATACPTHGSETATVAAVEPRLELRLTDGRVIRLAGLDPPLATPDDPDRAEKARAKVVALLADTSLTLAILAKSPDRWGRMPALAFPTADSDAGGLAAKAIAAGLGRYLAEPAAHACRDTLLAAEQAARSAKLGLWADPYYAILAVDDRAGFGERAGTIVLAEGRLSAVQPSVYRTTLRFAAPRPDSYGGFMLVATIPPRVMKTFRAQQVDVTALIGQRLRFRGLLDLRFGPRVELQGPDDLETVTAPAADAGSPNPN